MRLCRGNFIRSPTNHPTTKSPYRQSAKMIFIRSSYGFSRHRNDLDERHARGVEGCQHPHRLARRSLRQRRLRRRAVLQHAERLGVLPSRCPHAAADRVGEDLPDGLFAGSAGLDERRARDDPRERDEGLLHPSARLSRLRDAGRQPARQPGRRRDHGVGLGCVPRPRSARGRRRRQGQLVDAHGAEHAAGDGQERRRTTPTPSSSRWKRSPTATPKASRSTSTAT